MSHLSLSVSYENNYLKKTQRLTKQYFIKPDYFYRSCSFSDCSEFGNSRIMLIITIYETKIDPEEYQKNFNVRVLNHIDMKTGVKAILRSSSKDGHILTVSAWLMLLGELADDIVNKPQWEDLIITDLVYDEVVEEMVDGKVSKLKPGVEVRSERIFRCHHGIMDGASFLQMTSVMTHGGFPFSADPKIPLFSGITNHSWSRPINLEKIKEIKSVTRNSVPTILANVIAGALRKRDESLPCSQEG
ncbi:unnamed protein product [Allacma fusca]|uniref:Uncharacterized protein n=1 Tax=Allacma fusca TaxID=39272 RepID=A0A8J2JS48_9HEXA|nr:unnamed protein product [Allacma fusca]